MANNQQDEQKMRQIAKQVAQEEMRAFNSAARFGQSPIQRHVHNNLDSPYALQTVISYIGVIFYDGTFGALPKGWSAIRASTGFYTITHNLGPDSFYVPLANAIQSTNAKVVTVISPFANEVDINWFDIGTGAATDTSFVFTITVVNNRSTQPPIYVGSLIE